jgi:hypothetical protein
MWLNTILRVSNGACLMGEYVPLTPGVEMIPDDDFDSLGIEIAGERLVVWTAAGMQEVILPHAPRDTAEVLGSLIQGQVPVRGPIIHASRDKLVACFGIHGRQQRRPTVV